MHIIYVNRGGGEDCFVCCRGLKVFCLLKWGVKLFALCRLHFHTSPGIYHEVPRGPFHSVETLIMCREMADIKLTLVVILQSGFPLLLLGLQ